MTLTESQQGDFQQPRASSEIGGRANPSQSGTVGQDHDAMLAFERVAQRT